MCETTHWTAAKESAKKSSSKLDEEGLEIAVCRHGILLKALNMFRGEIFAYPLFLQKKNCRHITRKHQILMLRCSLQVLPVSSTCIEALPWAAVLTRHASFFVSSACQSTLLEMWGMWPCILCNIKKKHRFWTFYLIIYFFFFIGLENLLGQI